MTKPKRKQLERDLIATRQQLDKANRERDIASVTIANLRRDLDAAQATRPLHARVTEPIRQWLDDLAQAVGL